MSTLLWSWLESASAQDANVSDLPKIISHSKPGNTVYVGDKLKLVLNVEGKDLLFRWISKNKTLCDKAECEVDTKDWGIEKHAITAIAYNLKGSQEVRFIVRVFAHPKGKSTKPRTLVPELVTAQIEEHLTPEDFTVRSLMGIGYSYQKGKVQVIAQTKRRLDWGEKIKSHTKGVVIFGKDGSEEHFVLQGGTVALSKSESGRRALRLLQGAMRSRQMQNTEPSWSVLVDEWLQVDTDTLGDVIVYRKGLETEDPVGIAVLRGYASVRYQFTDPQDASKSEVRQIVLPPGSQLDIKKNAVPAYFTKPENKIISNIFVFTSAQYLYDKKLQKNAGGRFITENIKALKDTEIADAIKTAEQQCNSYDYIMCLENLLPIYRKAKADYNYLMILAKAYQGLGLLKYANQMYTAAGKLQPENGEPYFQIGLMYTEARNWRKAVKYLELAEDYDYEDQQALYYYLGVAKFNLDAMLSARNHFRYSLWRPDNLEMYLSAQKFLILIGDERPYGALGFVGGGKDSNVFRLPPDMVLLTQEDIDTANYYHGYGKLYYNGYNTSEGFLQFLFDAEKFGYLNSKLKDIEIVTQRILADWTLRILGDDPKNMRADFEINVVPYLKLVSVGEKRAADSYGIKLGMGSPSTVLAPRLITEYVSILDPFPAELDVFDPIRFEPLATATDRSGTLSMYGLGFTFVDELTYNLGLEVSSASLKHKQPTTKIDDFTALDVKLMGENQFYPWLKGILNVNYGSRNFKDSADSRKDTMTGGSVILRYLMTASFWNDLRVNYKDQKSNRESSAYKRYEAGLYFTLEL